MFKFDVHKNPEAMVTFIEEEFLSMLANYNETIWPVQILAYIIAVTAVVACFIKTRYSDRVIMASLVLFWLWNGIVFSAIFWSEIYPYAYLFAALLTSQGLLFAYGMIRSEFSFRFRLNGYSVTGLLFIVYALLVYQLIGMGIGHDYPRFFAPGLTPCPTAIFTFGILLLTDKRFPNYFLAIPIMFALGGIMAALNGIIEDYGLITAGILGTVLLYRRNKLPKAVR